MSHSLTNANDHSDPPPTHPNKKRRTLNRPVVVCERCRSKKIRCDLQQPKCGACRKANNAPCVPYQSVRGAPPNLPTPPPPSQPIADHVAKLEFTVRHLTRQLSEAQRSSSNESRPSRQSLEAFVPSVPPSVDDAPVDHCTSQHPANSLPPSPSPRAGALPSHTSRLVSPISEDDPPSDDNCDPVFDPFIYSTAFDVRAGILEGGAALGVTRRGRRGEQASGEAEAAAESGSSNQQVQGLIDTSETVPFPPYEVTRSLVKRFFDRINTQVPVLDRNALTTRLEAMARQQAEAGVDLDQNGWESGSSISLDEERVLHLVLAATTASMSWNQRSAGFPAEKHLSSAFRLARAADRYGVGSPQQHLHGCLMWSSTPTLQELKCAILVTIYSLIRPLYPGIWQTLGSATRCCTALGLFHEVRSIQVGDKSAKDWEENSDEPRRLFWSCYMLDRFVCFNLKLPFSIADSSISTRLPWVRPVGEEDQEDGLMTDGRRRRWRDNGPWAKGGDSSANRRHRKDLAMETSLSGRHEYDMILCGMARSIAEDPTRWVSMAYLKLRQLQSEIVNVLCDPRGGIHSMRDKKGWRKAIEERLLAWHDFAPCSSGDLDGLDCDFNPLLLELNYLNTCILLGGSDLRHSSLEGLDQLESDAIKMIKVSSTLERSGSINFNWVSAHNLSIASTFYLFATWQRVTIVGPDSKRHAGGGGGCSCCFTSKSEEVTALGEMVSSCLRSFSRRTRTGRESRLAIERMFTVTVELCKRYEEGECAGFPASGVESQDRISQGSNGHDWLRRVRSRLGRDQRSSPLMLSSSRTSSSPSSSSPLLTAQSRDNRMSRGPEQGTVRVPALEPDGGEGDQQDDQSTTSIHRGNEPGGEMAVPSTCLHGLQEQESFSSPEAALGWGLVDFLPRNSEDVDLSCFMNDSLHDLQQLFSEAGIPLP
ncbi:hypothetical protein IE53DRAFT_385077 [Violaceomyces palustris]|uniref:Uncharacterized protein n=1 Tax=Violaceomyces palustris TaxID=1673888 RepID=A0ACD0P2Z2_9BASI|nr:hypothetical protein IE53DRAFT_385077 [Violaceomyces palustris]